MPDAPKTSSNGDPWARALDAWGPNAELTALSGEAAELVAAIVRRFQGRTDLAAVYEEVCGVRSLLRSLQPWFDEQLGPRVAVIEDAQRLKLERLLEHAEDRHD